MFQGIIHRIPQLLVTLAGLFLFGASATTVNAQDFEGKKITEVQIRYRGPQTVDKARLRANMSVKKGQEYSASRLDDDVHKLYESGLVDDVRFLAEEQGNGVKIIAEVSTRSKIVAVGFVGNHKFKDTKLRNVTKLKPGGVISDQTILEARRNILKHYRAFGYPDVTVQHRIQASKSGSGASDLIFIIDEGARSEVRKIKFIGNHSVSAKTLQHVMETKEKGWLSFITKSGRIDSEKLDTDIDKILDHYRNLGYLRVKLKLTRQPVDDERIDLIFHITEGAKYTVNSVSFGKIKVFKPSELASVLTLVAGDGYSAKKMRADIRTIRSYYGSKGYADAAISPDLRDAAPNKVNIIYHIDEGGRYRVGKVTIEGNNKTQDRVIRREVPMKPGKPLNSVEMDTTRRRLKNMNYFSDVQVTDSPSSQKGYRDINILVEEKNTASINFGLGFSSVDRIVGFMTIEQTNFDISDWSSFTGAGQRFNTKIQYGSQRKDFTLGWTEPWLFGKRLALGVDLFYRSALYYSPEYEQGQLGGAISLRKPFGKYGYLKGGIRIENIKIDVDENNMGLNPDGTDQSLFRQYDGKYLRNALSLNYVHDTRDSNQLPRKGHKVDVGIQYVGLGGDVDAVIFTATGAQHWNLWADTILSLKGNIYVADSTGDDDVQIFDKKALGGAHSLRGFDNRDVGPRDPFSGEVIGGNTAAFFTVEYTFPLIERVRGAIFYDVGIVNEDSWDFANDFYHDAGFGLRLNLPFGPLAVDYGFPLKSPDPLADQGGQFSFYLDYAF